MKIFREISAQKYGFRLRLIIYNYQLQLFINYNKELHSFFFLMVVSLHQGHMQNS